MKKYLSVACLSILVMFMAVPAWTSPIDTLMWSGQLDNAGENTEIEKATELIGVTAEEFNFTFRKYEFSEGPKILSGWSPGWEDFSWDYAFVKFGRNWNFYRDDNGINPYSLMNGDDLLTTNSLKNGVSHVSFFSGTSPAAVVPEPGTLLLLGFGLIGFTGLAGRKKKRGFDIG